MNLLSSLTSFFSNISLFNITYPTVSLLCSFRVVAFVITQYTECSFLSFALLSYLFKYEVAFLISS